MSTIDLLRHGEPAGGVRYRGDGVDDPLTERGWAQMWAAVGEPSDWTHVVSSPLRRCRSFAEAVAERFDLPLLVDERFRETGFGTWEGRRHEE
ncbi:MAG: histidine phosphatase family protein, partial [Sedimenticolaceae bacterium]